MSSNNETNNPLGSLKGLRSGTHAKLSEFTKTIGETKRQILALNRLINERCYELKTKEDEAKERLIDLTEDREQPKAVETVIEDKPQSNTVDVPEAASKGQPEVNSTPLIEEPKKPAVQPRPPKKAIEPRPLPVEAKPQKPVGKSIENQYDARPKNKEARIADAPKKDTMPVQPKPIVKTERFDDKKRQISTEKAENNKKVAELAASTGQKTYMDDSGNLRVRRFLDLDGLKPRSPRPQGVQPNNERRSFDNNRPRPPFPPRDNNRPRPPMDGVRKHDESGQADRRPSTFVKKQFTSAPPPSFLNKTGKTYGNKNKTAEKTDDKKAESRRNLLIRNFDDFDDDRTVHRRARPKKQEVKFEQLIKKIDRAVINSEEVQIKTLSEKTGISVSEIIKKLLLEGIRKTANDKVEFAYAEYIAGQFGVELIQKLEKTAEEVMIEGMNVGLGIEELPDDTKRAPIVTVMGHVDHGKTSLLDAIKKTNVAEGEAGGITQHIGAYQVFINKEPITFIDTPGHEAFTAMRARGAQVTDVAIIVVAADDGVMPQSIEAINHAKAADVPIIVAINKMDKPTANPDNVKTQLSEHGLISEEWGGDTIMVPVSAKTGKGLDRLLESILIVSEVKDLKANHSKRASGTVIEAKLDKGKGPVATILVQNGTLSVGDNVVAGAIVGKVRAMIDNTGKNVKKVGPSCPVEVLGFEDVPKAGDFVYCVDEKLAKQVASERKDKEKVLRISSSSNVSLDDLYGRISEGNIKVLNLIVKCDVQGSLEALKLSLGKISNDEVKIAPIHGGVGAITETDVMLAKASNAIIIGFNVRADNNAKIIAEKNGVDIRLYRIIYDAVDDITSAMKGMLAPRYQESVIGSATVREVFKITGIGTVAGCYVTNGKILRSAKVRIYRDNIIIYDGEINALKRFKDDVKEVAAGFECGMSIVNYNDIKQDDVFEIYSKEQIKA